MMMKCAFEYFCFTWVAASTYSRMPLAFSSRAASRKVTSGPGGSGTRANCVRFTPEPLTMRVFFMGTRPFFTKSARSSGFWKMALCTGTMAWR